MKRTTSAQKNIAKIARGAVFTALSCVLLTISYPFAALDLTVASFAAILVWIMRLEYGAGLSLMVYAATTTLCFIITPGNSGVICYAFIFGWYPVYKVVIEKHVQKKFPAILLKLLAVIAAFALMLTVFFKIFVGEMSYADLAKGLSFLFPENNESAGWFEQISLWGLNRLQWLMIAAYLIFAPLITLIYDLLLSKFAIVYFYKIRPILVKARFFGELTAGGNKKTTTASGAEETKRNTRPGDGSQRPGKSSFSGDGQPSSNETINDQNKK